ncbi:hypothetical protein L6164_015324 [Bauhinia variegata]|uniref:Uncharacterized protein n=1 Tax=Bauhinia variegata TaxID=167791 RepID=A0ACB9NMA1_BAUVA|nr:hypothetical protein L6164_015324 [Bauhinia variegata]
MLSSRKKFLMFSQRCHDRFTYNCRIWKSRTRERLGILINIFQHTVIYFLLHVLYTLSMVCVAGVLLFNCHCNLLPSHQLSISVQPCRIKMPETYVVHLGTSKELMEVAEDSVAKRVLRELVRESLGVRNDDLLFAIINSVSRGKGQDLFLRSFYESLQLIQERKLQVPTLHAVVVGSDMTAQTKFEKELRRFLVEKKIQDRVHFVNKILTVAPYLASIDVLVQNSQSTKKAFPFRFHEVLIKFLVSSLKIGQWRMFWEDNH